ncbi:MAG: DUF3135 domain-containing protein [Immundisolibacteraceae bacterium]|nr:DUF3135 domain-containing protein [Immundisolibacteraceae bacterium]
MKGSKDFALESDYDFDEFVALSALDPEEFELRRSALIEANILAAPDHLQQRLRHMQCRADLVRDSAHSPLDATYKLSTMMWDSVTGPRGLIESLNAFLQGDRSVLTPLPEKPRKATVLAFPGTES